MGSQEALKCAQQVHTILCGWGPSLFPASWGPKQYPADDVVSQVVPGSIRAQDVLGRFGTCIDVIPHDPYVWACDTSIHPQYEQLAGDGDTAPDVTWFSCCWIVGMRLGWCIVLKEKAGFCLARCYFFIYQRVDVQPPIIWFNAMGLINWYKLNTFVPL